MRTTARWRHAAARLGLLGLALLVVAVADARAHVPDAAASTPLPQLPAGTVLRLATLDWPPFVGAGLPDNGLSTAMAEATAQRLGASVHVDYFPWKRAMQVGARDATYAGYFPAYYTDERARHCHFSAPLGHSTLGLATLRDAPLRWQRLADLGGIPLGVVAGYSNGRAFDDLVRDGRLLVDPSPGDASNLRKLLAHHVRAVVIDRLVLRYLLLSDPTLAAARGRIVFDPRPIADLTLHVCFQDTPQGERLQRAFDAALRRVDPAEVENRYFRQLASARPGDAH